MQMMQQQQQQHAEQMALMREQMAAQQEQSDKKFAELLAKTTAPKPDLPHTLSKNFQNLEKLKERKEFKMWSWKLEQAAKKAFGKDAEDILAWARDRNDDIILDSDVAALHASEGWDIAVKIHEQLHGILIEKFENGTAGMEILRNTSGSMGLEAWRKISKHYDPSNRGSRLVQLRALVKEQAAVAPDKIINATENWLREKNKVMALYETSHEVTCPSCSHKHKVESPGMKAMMDDISIVCLVDMCPKI